MTKHRIVVYLAFAFLPAFLLCVVIAKKRQIPPTDSEDASRRELGANDPYLNVRQRWESLHFEKVENTPDFRARITSLTISNEKLLSEIQKSELRTSIYQLIMAFHTGNYDDYLRFRTPISATFNPKAITYHQKILKDFCSRPGEELPKDPETVVQLIWERNYGGSAFKEYWKGICLTNVHVQIERTNQNPAALFSFALKAENTGVREIMPTFAFPRDPISILREESHLLFSRVILTLRPAEPDPIHTVFLSYYWDGASSKWLPWEMASGNSQQRKRDPMF